MSDSAHRTSLYALRLKRLGIDTYQEPVIYMHAGVAIGSRGGMMRRSLTVNTGSAASSVHTRRRHRPR